MYDRLSVLNLLLTGVSCGGRRRVTSSRRPSILVKQIMFPGRFPGRPPGGRVVLLHPSLGRAVPPFQRAVILLVIFGFAPSVVNAVGVVKRSEVAALCGTDRHVMCGTGAELVV